MSDLFWAGKSYVLPTPKAMQLNHHFRVSNHKLKIKLKHTRKTTHPRPKDNTNQLPPPPPPPPLPSLPPPTTPCTGTSPAATPTTMATPSTGTPGMSRRLDPLTGTSAILLFAPLSVNTSPLRLASLWLVVAMLVISGLTFFEFCVLFSWLGLKFLSSDLGFLREFGLLPFLGSSRSVGRG